MTNDVNKDLTHKNLFDLYINKHRSASEIAKLFSGSEHKINYWLHKCGVKKRNLSDAIYFKHNPNGDPFKITTNLNKRESEFKALGIGIYWREGDKSCNNTSVRVGNTDPFIIKKFREFLRTIYKVKEKKFSYGLILFNDIKESEAVNFWRKRLGIKRKQLGKITVIPPQGKGTYESSPLQTGGLSLDSGIRSGSFGGFHPRPNGRGVPSPK